MNSPENKTSLKTITIGDLHGKDYWKSIETARYDRIVFIGDYVDGSDHSDKEILDNLKAIIELKESEPAKVILLLGNHDVQYLYYPEFRCSGFRRSICRELEWLFYTNNHLFQIAYQIGNTLWTHAGISGKFWYNSPYSNDLPTAVYLNILAQGDRGRHNLFAIGVPRGGFWNGGIIWADQTETMNDYYSGFHQIVGHTKVDEITRYGDEESSITYVDCLNSKIEFLERSIDV